MVLLNETLTKPIHEFGQALYWYRKFPNSRVSFVGVHLKVLAPSLKVKIGDDSHAYPINLQANELLETRISIGSGCRIAQDVIFIMNPKHMRGEPSKNTGESGFFIEIGDKVMIGDRAIIMQNVRIGDGAMVGAGAVVTHDVAPNDIVAGVPARSILSKSRTRKKSDAVKGRK